ncbi:hypothetical protein BGZ54_002373, partial [Gamsiella multidivaricata]
MSDVVSVANVIGTSDLSAPSFYGRQPTPQQCRSKSQDVKGEPTPGSPSSSASTIFPTSSDPHRSIIRATAQSVEPTESRDHILH